VATLRSQKYLQAATGAAKVNSGGFQGLGLTGLSWCGGVREDVDLLGREPLGGLGVMTVHNSRVEAN
jgi:hypothetical protein